MSRKKRAASNR